MIITLLTRFAALCKFFLFAPIAFFVSTLKTASFPTILHGQEKSAINAVIIGVGGRGAGAGKDFLEAAKIAGVTEVVYASYLSELKKRKADGFYEN